MGASRAVMDNLLQELASPIKTFRLFALERVIQQGGPPELRQFLEDRQLHEDDEECQVLLIHALAAVRAHEEAREAPDPGLGVQPPDEGDLTWPVDDPPAQLDLLTRLPADRVAEMAPRAPIWLAATEAPHIQAAILRTFRAHWPEDHLEELAPMLGANSLAVRSAALQLLIDKVPQEVGRFLPRLLSAEDPRLRSLAIQGLAAIDLESALEHIDAMLVSAQPASRGFAIRNCLFLPFDRVKPLLLKSLAVECFPELIEKSGAILRSNPDPETPYRLWELIERAPSKLQPALKGVLQGVCQSLRDSGLLGEGFQEFQDHLQEWVHRRVAIHKVQTWLEREPDPEMPEDGNADTPDPTSPYIRWALEQALSWDLPSSARQRVACLLAPPSLPTPTTVAPTTPDGPTGPTRPTGLAPGTSPPPAPATSPTTAVEEGAPRGSSPVGPLTATPSDPQKALLLRLNQLQDQDRQEARALLGDLLTKGNHPPAVLAAAFRAAARLRFLEFVIPAERLLKSNHESLLAAVLDYLGTADPDRVMPFLGKFLQSRSRRVKGAALELIRRLDPPRALSALEFMLSNRDESEQEQALACMVHFEFSLIRKLLTDFLARNPPEAMFLKGLCLFQANPEKENLYPLYCLEKNLLPPLDAKVRKVREATIQALSELGLPIEAEVQAETHLEDRRKADEERRRTPSPFSPARVKQAAEGPTWLARLLETLGWREWHAPTGFEPVLLVVAVFLVVVGWYAMREPPPPPTPTGTMRPGAVLAQRLEVEGRVTRVFQDRLPTIEMTGPDGVKYSVEVAIEAPVVVPGDLVQVVLVPVRVTRLGVVIARCLSLKKA